VSQFTCRASLCRLRTVVDGCTTAAQRPMMLCPSKTATEKVDQRQWQ
jgi:hypothetical protein